MIDFNTVLNYSDQPVTCPLCGVRTEIILDLSHTRNQIQLHQCLNTRCGNSFVVESESEEL